MICSQKHIIHSRVWCTSQNIMIVIQYICIFLYVCQMSKFTYSNVIGRPEQSLSVDLPKCSFNDRNCFESNIIANSSVMAYFSKYTYILWSYYKGVTDDNKTNSITILIQNEEEPADYDHYNELYQEISNEDSTKKVKRSLELVEEQPPEGTYRPSTNNDVTRSVQSMPSMPAMPSLPSMPSMPSIPSMPAMPSMPSIPSMPAMPSMPSMPSLPSLTIPSIPEVPTMPSVSSIPQPPTMPSNEPKNTNTEATKYDVTTKFPDVEQLETTTEDYGNIGEPNCDYDPITFVLKCGINLITSIFGLSDTCCKPII